MDDLVQYISSGSNIVPAEAMTQLNKLLFKELEEYCAVCEDDRMICVLSPMCPKRILLKVRIQAGAEYNDIPQFCYEQAVNNIRRFLSKNTTLYTPEDELIYNKDFIDLMFPRLYKKFMKYYNTDLDKLHDIIEKSRVPAVNLDFRHADRDMFRKIIRKDKVIREGTFIYDISGEFLIVWYEEIIFISNFRTNITIVNAKEDVIQDLKIIDLVFHIYCGENDVIGFTHLKSPNQMTLMMKIAWDQIHMEWLNPNETYFQQIIDFLTQHFFQVQFSTDEENNLVISMQYRNLGHFLKRNKLIPINYMHLHKLTNMMGNFRKSPQNTED